MTVTESPTVRAIRLVQAEAVNDALKDLRERLVKASDTLSVLGQRPPDERLKGKAEGVRLALSYVEEALRLNTGEGAR